MPVSAQDTANRIAAAKSQLATRDGKTYLQALGPAVNEALRYCVPGSAINPSDIGTYAVLADVNSDGKLINVTVEPPNEAALCFKARFGSKTLPPPPRQPGRSIKPYPVFLMLTISDSSPRRRIRLGLELTFSGLLESSRWQYQCPTDDVRLFMDRDQGRDGFVQVEFTANKNGRPYGPRYAPHMVPTATGVDATFRLAFTPAGARSPALRMSATGTTPREGAASEFLNLAVTDLLQQPAYKLACSAIAALLGLPVDYLPFLDWAAGDTEGRSFLEQIRFQPTDDVQRAYWLVATHDFTGAADLGELAVRPLSTYLNQFIAGQPGLPEGSPKLRAIANKPDEVSKVVVAAENLVRAHARCRSKLDLSSGCFAVKDLLSLLAKDASYSQVPSVKAAAEAAAAAVR